MQEADFSDEFATTVEPGVTDEVEPEGTTVEVTDPFQAMVLISLTRIYDAQMAFLASVNPAKASELAQLHDQGQTLAPPFRTSAF